MDVRVEHVEMNGYMDGIWMTYQDRKQVRLRSIHVVRGRVRDTVFVLAIASRTMVEEKVHSRLA